MADETLKAFELGASLFDRAQTQKRMMEQFQQQTAESVLQRQGLELQNKIRDISLADAIGEQKSQVEEFDAFSTLGKQVSDYLNNPKPDAKFPVVPAFKSKQYRIEADRMLNNLEKYSARAELLKTQDRARTDSITKQTAILKEAMSIPGAVNIDPNTDVPTINWPVYNAGRKQLFESQVQKTQAQTTSILGNLEVAKNNLIRLQQEGKDKVGIENAKMAYRKALDRERLDLEGEKVDILREKTDIEREKSLKGAGAKPTKLDLDELEFSEAVLNGIKPLEPYLSQDIFGPAFNIKVKAGEVFGGSLPEKTVNQFYENMRTGALFKRGGKALTKTEVDRVTSSIGKPTDVGFSNRIGTFKQITAQSIKDRVEKLRMQGITSNPQYGAYVNELERRADEILGVETAPQQQPEIRSFNSIEEAQSANLPVGTRISVGGRPATIK